jgi:hypothetical protein
MFRPYVFLTLNTDVNGLWTPGTTISGDIAPCHRSAVKVSAIAGYKLSVLGMAELSDNSFCGRSRSTATKTTSPAASRAPEAATAVDWPSPR